MCTNSTNKGVFVGNAACTAGLLGDCWPDIHVVSLQDARQWGRLDIDPTANVVMVHSFSFGTYSCNQGTTNCKWIASTNQHPVIAQDLFRISNGRIEQIGMAWVKHGFFALSNTVAACGPCTYDTDGTSLGVGCADPYTASGENGTQSRLGPRSHINPTTGFYNYNTASWPPNTGTVINRRLQAYETDLDVAGATFWVQGQYVTADDALAGRALNNCSYRRVTFGAPTTYTPTMQGSTVTKTPVIFAWRDNGLGVGMPDPGVTINSVDVPDDGRYYVGSKVTDLGNGTWRYEYAVQNINSDRAGAGFSVPTGPGVTVSNIGFHAPFYHSGETYDPAPWVSTADANGVHWSPAPLPNPNPQNLTTKGLFWATIYNFRFDANVGPASAAGPVSLTLLKPGTPTAVNIDAFVPMAPPVETGACCAADGTCTTTTAEECPTTSIFLGIPSACTAGQCAGACCQAGALCTIVEDAAACASGVFVGARTLCNASGNHTSPCCDADFNASGAITVQDLFDFLAAWFERVASADFNRSESITVQDLFDFLAAWFARC